MKILYLLPHFDEERNSFSKLLAPILEELQSRGVEFEIWSANRGYSGRFRSAHRPALPPRFKYEFIGFPISLIWTSFSAWLWRRRNPHGIIHNIGGGSSLVHDLITAHACHAQYVRVKLQYGEVSRLLLNPIHSMILLTEWFNYIRRPKVIAVSGFVKAGLERHHPALRNHIRLIENAVSPPPALPAVTKGRGFHILMASNNHQHKGLGPLLEAMSMAKEHGMDWRLQVAGVDPFEEHWRKESRQRGLEERVQFLGHSSRLQELMAAADIFCMPSKYESFGMVYLEAAQVACPSYGAATGVLEDLYDPKEGPALLAHPVQAEEVFRGLRYWFEHPAARQKLGRDMQERARKYSVPSMVQRTLALYREMAGQA